jgi:hypothetical protein
MQCLNASRDLVFAYVSPKNDKFPFPGATMNHYLRQFFIDIRKTASAAYNPSSLFQGVT